VPIFQFGENNMLNKKDFFLFFILSFCISSCVYGPETEKKSIFNYLNGKHYRQPAFAEAVRLPVFKEQIPESVSA
jgi:hypothetical protein